MQTMRRIDVQINGKLVGSCDSISKVSSPLFKDILDPWIDIKGFVPEKPSLNKNQQIVLEWLKEAYKRTKWSSPFGTVYSTINTHELFVRTRLTKAQQYQVLAAFAEWGMEQEDE